MNDEGKPIGTPVGVIKPLIGRTTLKINAATMNQAVEDYLKTKVFREDVNIKVEDIQFSKEGQCPTFTISILTKED